MVYHSLTLLLSLLSVLAVQVTAFDLSRADNLAVYWGATGSSPTLAEICTDGHIDTVLISFVDNFDVSTGTPRLDTAVCSDCTSLAGDIKMCQKKGTIVTISVGGANGYVALTDQKTAEAFADAMYNTFLGGNSSARPFADAILDGIDLDLEALTTEHWAPFVNRIAEYSKKDNRKYYMTAAPQCPFPDLHLTDVLNNAPFDAIYIQFYNNYCGLQDSSAFNFDTCGGQK